jgi:hypothetical protein
VTWLSFLLQAREYKCRRKVNPVHYAMSNCQVLGFSQSWEVSHVQGFLIGQTWSYNQPTSIFIHINSLCHFSCFPYVKLWICYLLILYYRVSYCIIVLLSWSSPLTWPFLNHFSRLCLCFTSPGTGGGRNYCLVCLLQVGS